MIKKVLVTIILIIQTSFSIGQPEQIALDFYVEKIFPRHKPYNAPTYKSQERHRKYIIRYDGKIKPMSDYYNYRGNLTDYGYQTILDFYKVKSDFYSYNIHSSHANNYSIIITKQDVDEIQNSIILNDIAVSNLTDSLILRIPKRFSKRSINGLRQIKPYRIYDIGIYPSVLYNDYYYVYLEVLRRMKNYNESVGTCIYIKMTNTLKVIDWCDFDLVPYWD